MLTLLLKSMSENIKHGINGRRASCLLFKYNVSKLKRVGGWADIRSRYEGPSTSAPSKLLWSISEIVSAPAFIGEKSCGISSSRGIFNCLQSQANFSPFLLISWDSVRFIQTPPPPREGLSISRDLQTKVINKNNFSLYFEEIKFLLGSRHFHIPREFLPISPHLVGFILSRPHPLHEKFSPSRGIYRLKLLIKIIFPLYFQEIKFLLGSRHFHIPREVLPISPHLVGFILSRPHPLHEKFSPSRGIYRLKLLIKIIFPL